MTAAAAFLLLVRLSWSWQFAETGWGNLHHVARILCFSAGKIALDAIIAPRIPRRCFG